MCVTDVLGDKILSASILWASFSGCFLIFCLQRREIPWSTDVLAKGNPLTSSICVRYGCFRRQNPVRVNSLGFLLWMFPYFLSTETGNSLKQTDVLAKRKSLDLNYLCALRRFLATKSCPRQSSGLPSLDVSLFSVHRDGKFLEANRCFGKAEIPWPHLFVCGSDVLGDKILSASIL